jgi:hypothetical protein
LFQMFKQLYALTRCYELDKKLTIFADESMIHDIPEQYCIFIRTMSLIGKY